ncbi:MAG: TonB-dependent receptor [Burkholderiaceae bacterium]
MRVLSSFGIRRSGLAAIGIFVTGFAWAQQTELPQVVVTTGKAGSAIGVQDAASEGKVDAESIAARPSLRTGEIAEFVPGMVVVQHSGGGKANQYFLRGFNLDHGTEFATFVDGVPVNMRTHAHAQGYTDLNFLIPELVQSVRYRKGPYYAEEGDFASAGSARMTLFDQLPKGIASMSLGTKDYQRALLANSLDAGSGKLLYGLELGHNNGPFDEPDHYRKFNGLLRYSAGTRDDGYTLTAMAYRARWNATDQIPARAVASGRLDRLGAIDPSDGGDTARSSLSYSMRKRNGGGSGLFEFNAFIVRSRLDLYSNLTYFLNDPVNGDQFLQRERRTMWGANAAQSWSGIFAGLDMINRVGVQIRTDRIDPITLENTVERQTLAMVRKDAVRESSVGIFAENTTQWLPKLRSVAGIRIDDYRFDVTSNIAANSGMVDKRLVSPKLALVFGPWAETEFFASHGRGFHSNDARGVTAHVNPATGEALDPATPLVRSRGSEIGVRTEWIPGLQTSLTLWRLDIGSELLFSGDAGETVASRPSKRHGIEWTNQYVMTPWLRFNADFAFSRTRFADDAPEGREVPGAIRKVISLGVSVSDFSGWFGSLNLRYFGPRVLVEDNSVKSHGTALTNARVGYAIDRDTRVSLDVFNLFDRRAADSDYYYASRLRGESAAVDDIHYHPVEPRTARLTLTRRF